MKNRLSILLMLVVFTFSCATKKNTGDASYPSGKETTDVSYGFKATGNEPSWVLEIDYEKGLYFRSLATETFELNTPMPDPARPQDTDAVSYQANSQQGNLQVTIFNKPCSDNMSGEAFPYTVSVSARTRDMSKMMDFSGCGRYYGDYRLNNQWTLISINGESIDEKAMPRGAPTISFSLPEGRVMGNGGCNQYSGPVERTENKVSIGAVISTKMACPGLQVESQYFEILSNNTLSFTVNDTQLILQNGANELVFRKS